MNEADLQIGFYHRLKEIKKLMLREALRETVGQCDLTTLNNEADLHYSPETLKSIAAYGLRPEVFLPLPTLLKQNGRLLGYYRLLFGISQKEFYSKGVFGKFKALEEGKKTNRLSVEAYEELISLLAPIGSFLVAGLDELSLEVAHELQLLTLGPQLRGGRNTELGKDATARTFELIRKLVARYIAENDSKTLRLKNSLDQFVVVQFASDPDIVIVEELDNGPHKLVSIEIKGGTDYSNAHNRLGEAEKSHQKAKQDGFYEFWTIVRVNLEDAVSKKESPTTNRFFNLDKIEDIASPEAAEFRQQLASRLKIKL